MFKLDINMVKEDQWISIDELCLAISLSYLKSFILLQDLNKSQNCVFKSAEDYR